MPADSKNPLTLSIRCPECRQRFRVDSGLLQRIVECGGCEARFRVSDDVIIHAKKVYPGERAAPGLDNFNRVPLASAPTGKGMQPMHYAEFNHPEKLDPASPIRVIAGIVGAALMLVTALLQLFSKGPGGAFSGLTLKNQLIVGSFVALVGFALLVYANPRARLKAGFFALLLAAGVLSIPFLRKDQEPQHTIPGSSVVTEPSPITPVVAGAETEDLRSRFGTKPLETERARLQSTGGVGNVYGVYLTNLVERNMYGARDYLFREAKADPTSHPYPRDGGSYLMVLTGVAGDLDSVASIAANLGEVQEIHRELGVIVVKVNNELFVAASAEKVNNQKDPAFYQLNMQELGSVDLNRVERAVDRLALAKPTIFRADITEMLIKLMDKPGLRFHGNIARALLVWAEEPGPAGEAALRIVKQYSAEAAPVPESLVELIVKEHTPGAAPAIHDLWLSSPNLWQSKYEKFGAEIEPAVLEQVNAKDSTLQRSALTLLAAVGSQQSLPALRALTTDKEPSIRVLAERAITDISAR